MQLVENKHFDEMLASIRNKTMPNPCLLSPWLMCQALGLEYVVDGNYYIRRHSEDGTRFEFGAVPWLSQYSGEDTSINVQRMINRSQAQHEKEVLDGLYPSYVEVNMDGTDMTDEQIKARDKELEGKLQ